MQRRFKKRRWNVTNNNTSCHLRPNNVKSNFTMKNIASETPIHHILKMLCDACDPFKGNSHVCLVR